MAANVMEDHGVPLVYFSDEFGDSSSLKYDDAEPAKRMLYAAATSCEGVWDGDACKMQGYDCSNGNRVSVYERDAEGALNCVAKDACHKGLWDGAACINEDDKCEGSEESRVYVYVRDGEELVCEKRDACDASAWYSPDEDACVKLDDACSIEGIGGVVTSSESGNYCQLEVEERSGFRLTSRHVPVDSERACYDMCVSRASGCGAYSFDSADATCATAGLNRVRFARPRGYESCTEKPTSSPSWILRVGGERLGNRWWEPFNDDGFEMRYSSSADMDSPKRVENSGDVLAGPPGSTYYFKPRYGRRTRRA